jgi:two-component system, chemotaxis family, CheB/CheR fusion protein
MGRDRKSRLKRVRAKRKPTAQRQPAAPGRTDPPAAKVGWRAADGSFTIVGIGASAGGLAALGEFFTPAPLDIGVAFVVVSHQPSGHVSLLPDLLQKHTAMPVVEATDGMRVAPNHVYLSTPGRTLAMLQGALHVMDPDSDGRVALPIDYFFRSLADDQGDRAIGVILSGTGTDGTLGLKAIKAHAGMTMAQEPRAAKYAGMPESAIRSGVVDYVRPAGSMVEQIRTFLTGVAGRDAQRLAGDSPALARIFVALRDRTGHDFSVHKAGTSRRRIERRMNVHQIETIEEYLRYLQVDPQEIDALFRELLIGVTSFFRDSAALDALAGKGLPKLLDSRPDGTDVRVWVPGCSTGEEAYSLAILLREYLGAQERSLRVQIFATDLDRAAIETARAGVYPSGIVTDLTPERLRRWFVQEDSHYRVKKDIRDLVIFAPHDLLTDPPFTKLDLLSCRNLLIYLESRAQRRLVPLFHYALKPAGLLFLGASESIDRHEDLFATVDRKWKIFRRVNARRQVLEGFPIGRGKTRPVEAPPADRREVPETPVLATLVERMLLKRSGQSGVVVDKRGETLYVAGRAGEYLEPAAGEPTHHLLKVAREGLRHDLTAVLREAAKTRREAVRRGVRVTINGGIRFVNIAVTPITGPKPLRGLFLVTFETVPSAGPRRLRGRDRRTARSARPAREALVDELRDTKQRLQHSLEETRAYNEELTSANEELQSANEELQSGNEELETGREEMQSLNEELATVNAELRAKVDDLGDAQSDLQNLLNSTDTATVFLDADLNIKRFTPAARNVANLIVSDLGRPLSDIASKLEGPPLMDDAREVLQSLVSRAREIRSPEGTWYLMRALPYRTVTNTIGGVILTFSDVTAIKQAEVILREAQAYFESIVQTVRAPLVVLDREFRVVSANGAFYHTFGITPADTERRVIYGLGNGAWDIPRLRELLEKILPTNSQFDHFEIDHVFPGVGRKVIVLNARRLERQMGLPGLILLAMEEKA